MQELSFFWKVSNLIFDKRFPEEKTDQEQVPQDHFKYPFHSKFHFLLLHLKVTLLFAKSGWSKLLGSIEFASLILPGFWRHALRLRGWMENRDEQIEARLGAVWDWGQFIWDNILLSKMCVNNIFGKWNCKICSFHYLPKSHFITYIWEGQIWVSHTGWCAIVCEVFLENGFATWESSLWHKHTCVFRHLYWLYFQWFRFICHEYLLCSFWMTFRRRFGAAFTQNGTKATPKDH